MKSKFIVLVLIFIFILSSCSQFKSFYFDDKHIVKNTESIHEANNKFAFDILQAIDENNKSVFISPYSIFSALTMTMLGADGSTLREMQKTLYLNDSFSQKSMQRFFTSTGNNLFTANSLWIQSGMSLKQNFIKKTELIFNAKPFETDFARETEKSRIRINNWVAEKTKQRIKDLILRDMLRSDTRLVLVNALYFNNTWIHKFSKDATFNRTFFITNSTTRTVPMMGDMRRIPYYENNEFKAVKLDYNNSYSMIIVLPKNKDPSRISYDDYKSINFSLQEVSLNIPKFSLESYMNLKPVLESLGIKKAFTAKADFTKITDNSLSISDVIHKTFLDVNEGGTEAAAATAVIMSRTSINTKIKKFIADHPFLFLINYKDTIMFIGIYR